MRTKRKPGNIQLVDQLKSTNENLRFLHTISQKISEKKPLPQLLSEIMESSKLLMSAEASSLLLYDSGKDKLHFHVATGEKGEIIKKFTMEMGEGIAGWVAVKRKPLLIEDCYQDSRFNPDYDKKSNFRTRSMICVPLMRNEQLLGVIQVINKKEQGVFTSEDLSLFEILASQCAIAIENHQLTEKQIETEALEHELVIAREIQQHLLPQNLPDYKDLDVASILIPAKAVGGDYYNVIRVNEDQSLFFLADVCGKSISAALIVSIIDSCLHSYLKMHPSTFDLMSLVKMMNQILIEATSTTKFATSWFGLYHHKAGNLVSVNAGHNPPYLFREGRDEVISLKNGGLFLGGMDLPYESEELFIQPKDILVYYTDGVTEAWNMENEDYGEERLIRTIMGSRKTSAKEILHSIENDVKKHVGQAPQNDDITCIVLKKT